MPSGNDRLDAGTTQTGRWPHPLSAGFAPVDGRSLEQLLGLGARTAGLFNFVDLEGEIDGDWTAFFSADPQVVAALIRASDPIALARRFETAQRRVHVASDPAEASAALREMVLAALAPAQLLDGWHRALGSLSDGRPPGFARRLATFIREEGAFAVQAVRDRARDGYTAGPRAPAVAPPDVTLSSAWKVGAPTTMSSFPRRGDPVPIADALSEPFAVLLDGVEDLRAELDDDPQLAADGAMRPQIALYLTFLELFVQAQAQLNRFAPRLLDLYYDEVLRVRPSDGVGDELWLRLLLSEDAASPTQVVGAGTQAIAPGDEDEDIVYATEREIVVSAAKVARLHTLYVERGPLVREEVTDGGRAVAATADFVHRVLAGTIDPMVLPSDPWPTFGTKAPSDAEAIEPARIGLRIASPELLLSSGDRHIHVRLQMSEETASQVLSPRIRQIERAVGDEHAFKKIVREAFDAALTTEDGWLELPDYHVRGPYPAAAAPAGEKGSSKVAPECVEFELLLHVDADAPAIAPLPESVTPMLRLILRQEPTVFRNRGRRYEAFAAALLQDVVIDAIGVRTHVSGLTSVALRNTDGEVDPSSPFPAFGASPSRGSFLDVAARELFVKKPCSIHITFRWFGLPADDAGFAGYYRDYVIGADGKRVRDAIFTNCSFQAAVSVHRPGEWNIGVEPGADVSDDCTLRPEGDVFLFRTKGETTGPTPDGTLLPATTFELAPFETDDLAGFYDPAESALRFELVAPPAAFGQDLYAKNVLDAVLGELPDPVVCLAQSEANNWTYESAAEVLMACLGAGGPSSAADLINECLRTLYDALCRCLASCAGPGGVLLATKNWLDKIGSGLGQTGTARTRALQAAIAAKPTSIDTACAVQCVVFASAIVDVAVATDGTTTRSEAEAAIVAVVGQLDAEFRRKVAEALAQCSERKQELRYPNPPFLPLLQNVDVSYASFAWLPDHGGEVRALLPFGGTAPCQPGAWTLVPSWDFAGALMVGLSNAAQTDRVDLLSVAAAPTRTLDPKAEPPTWTYLDGVTWTDFSSEAVVDDSTRGLTTTGVVSLSLPPLPATTGSLMPQGFRWLRAAVTRDAKARPWQRGVCTNATMARWVSSSAAGAHLREGLPPASITGLATEVNDIAEVSQPLRSVGGRPAENRRAFLSRVSERLRHKDRAVVGWDYERLVLARFPQIWQVRTCRATASAPGRVTVVVVPGPDSSSDTDARRPRASAALLGEIGAFLRARCSPFVDLLVCSPTYVPIRVDAEVVFATSGDTAALRATLVAELIAYLSPWYPGTHASTAGGDRVADGDIIEFITTRTYVRGIAAITIERSMHAPSSCDVFYTSAETHRITAGTSVCGAEDPLR